MLGRLPDAGKLVDAGHTAPALPRLTFDRPNGRVLGIYKFALKLIALSYTSATRRLLGRSQALDQFTPRSPHSNSTDKVHGDLPITLGRDVRNHSIWR
jgi:hypothetical protein